MRYQEAITQVKNTKAGKYALVGMESFFKKQFIEIVKSFDSEFFVFYENDMQEALSTIQLPCLFEGRRTIVLMNFDGMKPEYFIEPVKNSCDLLVLVMTEKADLKSKVMTNILAYTVPVFCDKLKEYGNDYPLWISSVISNMGYKIESGVEYALYNRIGPSLYILSKEIEKLCLAKYVSKEIMLDDVKTYSSVTADVSTYDILDDLLRKDVTSALMRFSCYCRSHENLYELIKFLGIYFEKFYRIHLLREREFKLDDIADIVGIPRFILKTRYFNKVLAVGKSNISNWIDRLCDLEYRFRTFGGNKKVLFENFIYSFS